MLSSLLLLWVAAFPVMGSPGPATLSLAGIGTSYGFKRSLSYLLGIILGTTGVLLIVATGVTAIILTKPVLVTVLTLISIAYILYLAWKIATAPVGLNTTQTELAPGISAGFLLAIANPKAFAAIGAVFTSQTLIENNITLDTVSKVIALILVIVIVNTSWLAFGYVFSRILSNPTTGRVANIVFAIMLVLSVVSALVSLNSDT